MDHIHIQKQIRDNAEELQQFANSLQNWEQEMKNKEAELLKLNSQENVNTTEEEEDMIKKKADSHKTKGNDFVKVGKWKEALEEYTKSISLYPNDAVYYGNRSYCYMQLKNWVEAENDCDRALELKRDYVKVALRRANIRRKRDNIQGAAKDYNLVLVLEPKNTTALKEYEEIYPELKKFYSKFGLKLPEFVEMNPSSKTVQDDEPKHADITATSTHKKGFELVYTPSNKIKKESVNKKSSTPQTNPENSEKIGNYSVIYPLQDKPPHLRSKLPLRRIQIEDVYLNSDDDLALLP